MKKIFAVIACLAVALSMSACTSGGESSAAPTGNASSATTVASSSPASSVAPASSAAEESSAAPESSEAPTAQDSGTIGDYSVTIGDARLSKDREGNDVIIVSYEFTNNGEESSSFIFAVNDTAYQDGVELDTAYFVEDDTYDTDSQMKDIKTGGTLTVENAYVLSSATSPVEVDVEEIFSWEDDAPVLTKTFDPAAL